MAAWFTLLARTIYYGMTSVRGLQTLGEEYCDISMAYQGSTEIGFVRRLALFLTGVVLPFAFRYVCCLCVLCVHFIANMDGFDW